MRSGEQIRDYVLDQCIGRGGMGEVWRAHQRNPRRTVAIKIIRQDGDQAVMFRSDVRRGRASRQFCPSLRSRRKRKAWGASPRDPDGFDREPATAGDSTLQRRFRPLSRARILILGLTWGLRPRLYAYAYFAG